MYVQDILENLESEVLLFADDTCLFASANDPTETTKILNSDLEKISLWAKKLMTHVYLLLRQLKF